MDPMMIKEQSHDGEYSNNQWVEMNGFSSPHVQSPAHEHNMYNFIPSPHPGMQMEGYGRPMQPLYPASQQPQNPYPAQWPSMLASPSTNMPPQHIAAAPAPPTPAPIAPGPSLGAQQALPPITTQPAPPTQQSTRRTLTDQDRRRMCQYHEDNPSVKQTEIGAMFGVERSTVSKVLRQKEKYLFPEDGSRSPIKKAKGKFPDIERALSVWAKNIQKQGLPLNDNIIREKARVFATTVGGNDVHVKVNSSSWLEKFKQKNHLMGAKPSKTGDRKGSDAGGLRGAASEIRTPTEISPISPTGVASPSSLSTSQSHEKFKKESPDSFHDFKHGNSQSVAGTFKEIATPSASFSGAPHSPISPLYTPELVGNANSFLQAQNQRSLSAGNAGLHRPRSQTFPMLGIDPSFAGSNENLSQKQVEELMSNSVLETPVEDYPDRNFSLSSQGMRQISQSSGDLHSPVPTSSPSVMAPPPYPLLPSSAPTSAIQSPVCPPSQDEARRALELVMNFFQHQQPGVVDPQEYITMGKLMEKLKVQGSVGELPGGMHSIDRGQQEISRKRSIHSQ